MSANWTLAQDKAKEVREKYTLNGGSVNAFDIAQQEGISIEYFQPKPKSFIADASGFYDAEQNTIFLNADESAERQNFTLAHELGHYFLKHDPDAHGIYWRNSVFTNGSKPEAEKEADTFASELLMPVSLIEKYKKRYDLRDSDTVVLAKLLGVSSSALKYRLLDISNGRAT